MSRNYESKGLMVKVPKEHSAYHSALTIQEVQLFESFMRESVLYSPWRNIFKLMLRTGMRVGEVTGLQWSNVDFNQNTIVIDHTLHYCISTSVDRERSGGFAVGSTKHSEETRVIPMNPLIREALLVERESQRKAGINCKTEIGGYNDFVFVDYFGKPYHQYSLNKVLSSIIFTCNSEVLDANGEDADKELVLLPAFNCHALRNTFMTTLGGSDFVF